MLMTSAREQLIKIKKSGGGKMRLDSNLDEPRLAYEMPAEGLEVIKKAMKPEKGETQAVNFG
jgi:hypothetical protein